MRWFTNFTIKHKLELWINVNVCFKIKSIVYFFIVFFIIICFPIFNRIKMTNVGTTYATSENTISTPPPKISNEMPPPHTKKRRNRSEVWKHFIVSSEEEQKASCKYCDTKIKYNNGTSSMHANLSRCLIYKRQKTSSSTTNV